MSSTLTSLVVFQLSNCLNDAKGAVEIVASHTFKLKVYVAQIRGREAPREFRAQVFNILNPLNANYPSPVNSDLLESFGTTTCLLDRH